MSALRFPDWARWSLPAADSLTVIAYAAFTVCTVSYIERQQAPVWSGTAS